MADLNIAILLSQVIFAMPIYFVFFIHHELSGVRLGFCIL